LALLFVKNTVIIEELKKNYCNRNINKSILLRKR